MINAIIITCKLVEACFNECYLSAKLFSINAFVITCELVEACFNVRFAHSVISDDAVRFA